MAYPLNSCCLSNYRYAFKAQEGFDFPGSDADIQRFDDEIGTLASGAEQDEAMLEAMTDFCTSVPA